MSVKNLINKRSRMISLNMDQKAGIPKYKQIVNSIIYDIENSLLGKDDQLPSINDLSEEYYLSRDTVEKAYNELREKGIIISIPGKGFFVNRTNDLTVLNVLLVFNKLSEYKKSIYESFVKSIGNKAKVDLCIYNNDADVFEKRIEESLGNYNYYVIMSHFTEVPCSLSEVLKKIPASKLVFIDKSPDESCFDRYNCVCQNYEKDIYNALHSLSDDLARYKELVLVFPEKAYFPLEIKKGFVNFCEETSCFYKIIPEITINEAEENTAYIIIDEGNLIQLIKNVSQKGLKLGKDVGLLSYNENPLKEFLLEGITVISTDFEKMGEAASLMVQGKIKGRWENPFYVIRRKSL